MQWWCLLFFPGNNLLVASSGGSAYWNLGSFDLADSDLSDLNGKNMLFDDSSEVDSDTDLFDNDSESDTNAYSWDDVDFSTPNNDMFSDFAIATDMPYDCPSFPLLPTGMHARAESCANPDSSQGAMTEQSPEITTTDQVEEYWCSTSAKIGFGNIPVCDRSQRAIAPLVRPSELELEAYGIPPPSASSLGFKNLGWCSLRKLMQEILDENTKFGQFKNPVTIDLPLSVTPSNAFDCPVEQVWCCNAWLPEDWEYWTSDPVRNIGSFHKSDC